MRQAPYVKVTNHLQSYDNNFVYRIWRTVGRHSIDARITTFLVDLSVYANRSIGTLDVNLVRIGAFNSDIDSYVRNSSSGDGRITLL